MKRRIAMDEVKIWSVDGDSNVEPLASKGETDTESLLEETLVKNPSMLLPGLRLVGRQTPTAGGPLDLLGVDEEGRLVVFELKRGTLSRDAVAQIIDYASDLDAMDMEALASHISKHSGKYDISKIDDFQEWYGRDLESLKPLRLFLVGLGVDDRTESMVRFLAQNSEMDISLLTFHGFAYDGKTLLARQVEVEAAADLEQHLIRRRYRGTAQRANLEREVQASGVPELYYAIVAMFQENWPESRSSPHTWWSGPRGQRAYGLGVRLKGIRGMYARIDPESEEVRLVFYPRAKALCLDEFRQTVQAIQYETWPKDRDPLADPDTEIQFKLTPEEWETHKERLSTLTTAVYKAWETRDEDRNPV